MPASKSVEDEVPVSPAALEEAFVSACQGTDGSPQGAPSSSPILKRSMDTAERAGLSYKHRLMFACVVQHRYLHYLEQEIRQASEES